MLMRRFSRFACSVKMLYEYTNPRNDQWAPLVSEEVHAIVLKARAREACCLLPRVHRTDIRQPRTQNAERLDSSIIYDRDFDYDYFGFKARARSALLARSLVRARDAH
jgi:hypothetical protein